MAQNHRYPRILAVYNKPEYDRMFLRDAATGRKIFVYPTFPGFDPAFTADIQSNGGRNDIVTVRSLGCEDYIAGQAAASIHQAARRFPYFFPNCRWHTSSEASGRTE